MTESKSNPKPQSAKARAQQAPDEALSYPHPLFDTAEGKLFSKWNRNRVTSAQKIEVVPQLSARQWQALEVFDALVRRADLAHSMWLQPGDLQIINSHATLHSRTDFIDHEDAAQKRLLYRLWLAPPDGDRLPELHGHSFGQQARRDVGSAPNGVRHDDPDRALGPGLRVHAGAGQAK